MEYIYSINDDIISQQYDYFSFINTVISVVNAQGVGFQGVKKNGDEIKIFTNQTLNDKAALDAAVANHNPTLEFFVPVAMTLFNEEKQITSINNYQRIGGVVGQPSFYKLNNPIIHLKYSYDVNINLGDNNVEIRLLETDDSNTNVIGEIELTDTSGVWKIGSHDFGNYSLLGNVEFILEGRLNGALNNGSIRSVTIFLIDAVPSSIQ